MSKRDILFAAAQMLENNYLVSDARAAALRYAYRTRAMEEYTSQRAQEARDELARVLESDTYGTTKFTGMVGEKVGGDETGARSNDAERRTPIPPGQPGTPP